MKVPLSWLRDLVDIPEDPTTLGRRLTLAGLEVESSHTIGADWDPAIVVVGQIQAVAPHPNADRLRLVTVDLGGGRQQTVVTGAPNVREGQKVIFGGLGTRYIDNHDPERKVGTLKRSTIRGVQSEGMVMSEAELGLSDEHEGIIDLPADAPVGTPARDYLGDTVLEVEITPNLVHNFSVRGIAREVAALFDRPAHLPVPAPANWAAADGAAPSLVTISAPDLCARYVGAIIRGVTVAPSPRWLQQRLRLVGVRPISNIVDITNYVMLEFGQPLHAFDLRHLRAQRIIVRRSQPGETIETIDHERRVLDGETLVIADAERAVAVAGVIGGVDSEIADDTVDVLLESANFEMKGIRRTRRALRIRTEASSRFERGIDPELALAAAQRAAELMLELCPGARIELVHDNYPRPVAPIAIDFPLAEVRRLLGVEHPPATVVDVLRRLDFGVDESGTADGRLHVTVPTWRSDVRIPADIVEEVARVVGYENLPDTLPQGATPAVQRDPRLLFEESVRDTLVASGLSEIITYAWTHPEELARVPGADHWAVDHQTDLPLLEIINPLRPESRLMRPTLLPAVLSTLSANARRQESVRLFEVGSVYLPTGPDSLPTERRTLALGMSGNRAPRQHFAADAPIDFFDLKGVVEALFNRLGLTPRFQASGPDAFHPGRRAVVLLGDQVVGVLGELHPSVTADWDLDGRATALAEFSLDLLRAALPTARRFEPISRFQAVVQDLAVVVPAATPAALVQETIVAAAPYVISGVRLFDVYQGAPIPDGQKSLAFEVTLQSRDRDLPEHEIEKIRGRIIQRLKKDLNATPRT